MRGVREESDCTLERGLNMLVSSSEAWYSAPDLCSNSGPTWKGVFQDTADLGLDAKIEFNDVGQVLNDVALEAVKGGDDKLLLAVEVFVSSKL